MTNDCDQLELEDARKFLEISFTKPQLNFHHLLEPPPN